MDERCGVVIDSLHVWRACEVSVGMISLSSGMALMMLFGPFRAIW